MSTTQSLGVTIAGRPLKYCNGCGRKCPCVVIDVAQVDTLAPGTPAYVNVEKTPETCDYALSFGIPQGFPGGLVPDGLGCFLAQATDGTPVRACIVRKGQSSVFQWEIKAVQDVQE